jgi:hypothetical protein
LGLGGAADHTQCSSNIFSTKYLSFAQINGNMLPGEKGSQATG